MNTNYSSVSGVLFERLKTIQLPNGSFPSERYKDSQSHDSPNVFITGFLLTLLPTTYSHTDVVQKAISFLLQQQQETGSWNYWQRTITEKQQYPDDLDDTAISLAALLLHAHDAVSGSMTARFAHALHACEHAEGGPYNTWITDWQKDQRFVDIDSVVNANIAFCLSLLDVSLPNLTALAMVSIAEEDYYSEYYCSSLVSMYCIVRAHSDRLDPSAKQTLRSFLCSHEALTTPSSLIDTVCVVMALFCIENSYEEYSEYERKLIEKAMEYILNQSMLFPHKREPLYYEQKTDEGVWYCTSESVSIAFSLQAIHTYEQLKQSKKHSSKNKEYAVIENRIQEKCKEVYVHFACYKESNTFIESIVKHPCIISMQTAPYILYAHLQPLVKKPIEQEVLEKIAIATTLGGIGYTVLDAVLDEQLPVFCIPFAVAAIREMQSYYAHFSNTAELASLLTEMEQSSVDEYFFRFKKDITTPSAWIIPLQQYAIPNYQKSLGLLLPTVALCSLVECDDSVLSLLLESDKEYLKLLQQNDDAHDIIEDITAGRQTPIGALLCQQLRVEYPEKNNIVIPDDIPLILRIFWNNCFSEIMKENLLSIERMRFISTQLPESLALYVQTKISEQEMFYNTVMREYKKIQSFLASY